VCAGVDDIVVPLVGRWLKATYHLPLTVIANRTTRLSLAYRRQ
jgi:hypothetical protein